MKADEQSKKFEDGEKERIILLEIEPPIERLGGQLLDGQKVRLMRMSKPELQSLAKDLQGAPALKKRIDMITKAFTDSEHARQREKDKKYDGHPPANIDML